MEDSWFENVWNYAGDVEVYVFGKGIRSEEVPYDSWICSCGDLWSSYRITPPGNVLSFKFEKEVDDEIDAALLQ